MSYFQPIAQHAPAAPPPMAPRHSVGGSPFPAFTGLVAAEETPKRGVFSKDGITISWVGLAAFVTIAGGAIYLVNAFRGPNA